MDIENQYEVTIRCETEQEAMSIKAGLVALKTSMISVTVVAPVSKFRECENKTDAQVLRDLGIKSE